MDTGHTDTTFWGLVGALLATITGYLSGRSHGSSRKEKQLRAVAREEVRAELNRIKEQEERIALIRDVARLKEHRRHGHDRPEYDRPDPGQT